MPELAEFYLLETAHFAGRVESYLTGKGAAVTVVRAASELPPPDDHRWRWAAAIIDIAEAGPTGLTMLESAARCVVLTGKPSRSHEVLARAAANSWEALIKPYAPEELYFRLMRLWNDGFVWQPPDTVFLGGSVHAAIADAARKLVGCRYARLAEMKHGGISTVADSGDLSGAALVDRVLHSGRSLRELSTMAGPLVLKERLPSGEFEDGDRIGEVLAVPLRRTRAGFVYLLLVKGLEGSPFGNRDLQRAGALWTLNDSLFSTLGAEGYKRIATKLLAHVPSGIMVLDRTGKVFSVNRQGASILGVDEHEVVGRHAADLFALKGDDALTRAIKSGEPALRMEQKVKLPGGKTMVLGVSAAPIEPDEEVEEGSVLVFQDLSRVKRLEERVRRADQLASLGAMAAGMAHEIRNPLASVLTGVQILGSLIPGDPRAKRHTETIVQQITRVNRIVQDLLTLGRPAKPRIEPCPVDRPITHAVQGMGIRASDQGVTVRLDLPDTPPVALLDEGQIQQVLLNLLLNSVEATPQGGEVLVRVAEKADAGMVRIEVSDTGEGISPENLSHVFTPFFSTKAQGSGLGLSICNRIVSDHGGQLEITSVLGKGTTVALELPSAEPPVGSSARAGSDASPISI